MDRPVVFVSFFEAEQSLARLIGGTIAKAFRGKSSLNVFIAPVSISGGAEWLGTGRIPEPEALLGESCSGHGEGSLRSRRGQTYLLSREQRQDPHHQFGHGRKVGGNERNAGLMQIHHEARRTAQSIHLRNDQASAGQASLLQGNDPRLVSRKTYHAEITVSGAFGWMMRKEDIDYELYLREMFFDPEELAYQIVDEFHHQHSAQT